MDFINKAYGQCVDLFRTMTPAARITTALLFAVVVVSVTYLFRAGTDKAGEYLYGAQVLSDHDIDAVEGVIAAVGPWEREGNRIRVPRGQKGKYLAALAEAGVRPEYSGSAFDELFASSSPLDSRKVLELKERRARERELEITLRHLKSIRNASVNIQEIDKGGFGRAKVYRAVATVEAEGNRHLERDQIKTIRDIVAHGGGVEPQDVVVADSNADLSYRGTGKDGLPLAEDDPYASRQRLYEENIQRRIENVLAMYQGAIVSVRVELDRDLHNQTSTIKYDPQAVALETSSVTRSASTPQVSRGGRPGTVSNGLGNTPQQISEVAAQSTSDETREEKTAVAGATQTTTEKAPLVPTRVTASIRIPRTLFKQLWLEKNPPVDGQPPVEPDDSQLAAIETKVKQNINDAVMPLLPKLPPGEIPFPVVTVTAYEVTPVAAPPAPSMAATAGSWFAAHWQTLALLGVALFSVFFVRGMIRATPSPTSAPAAVPALALAAETVPHVSDEDEDEDDDDIGNSLKARFHKTGRSLRDELTELVREDPDAAANVISNWIGDAA